MAIQHVMNCEYNQVTMKLVLHLIGKVTIIKTIEVGNMQAFQYVSKAMLRMSAAVYESPHDVIQISSIPIVHSQTCPNPARPLLDI
jgi:hypothetical protein